MHSKGLPYDVVREAGFPSVANLRAGVILNGILNAFACITSTPVNLPEWDGSTYYEENREGEHWAVSFVSAGAVAVFFSSESSRNPFPDGSPPYDQAWYFRGMPPTLATAQNLALSQMHDLNFRCRNPAGAVITSAMWADSVRFTAVETWKEVYDHSLWVCRTHLLPPEDVIEWKCQGMGYSDRVKATILTLHKRRLSSTSKVVPIESFELQAMLELADGDLDQASSAEGLLLDVGISFGSYLSEP